MEMCDCVSQGYAALSLQPLLCRCCCCCCCCSMQYLYGHGVADRQRIEAAAASSARRCVMARLLFCSISRPAATNARHARHEQWQPFLHRNNNIKIRCNGRRRRRKARRCPSLAPVLERLVVHCACPSCCACILTDVRGTPAFHRVARRARACAQDQAICGIGAGIASTFCMQPLDLLKVKFQVATGNKRLGIRSALRDIVRKDGLAGLYRGIGVNMLGNSASWGLYFLW